MDPSYSVLVQTTKQDKCAPPDKNKSHQTKIVLIAVLVTFGGILLILLAVFIIIPRTRLMRKVRKAAVNSDEVELSKNGGKSSEFPSSPPPEIEFASDMHVSTAAGNFVVRM